MALNIKSFEETIKSFLDNYAKEDSEFATKYNNQNKTIEECCKYIYQEVSKNRNNQSCVALSDEVVFGMAIHYYDEDDIVVNDAKNEVVKVGVDCEEVEKPVQKRKPREKKVKRQKADSNIPEPLDIPLF